MESNHFNHVLDVNFDEGLDPLSLFRGKFTEQYVVMDNSEKAKADGIQPSINELARALMAIIRVQAEYNLDWCDGCERAAMFIDKNRVEFQRAVAREAQRLYKRRYMTELNKARTTIEKKSN